ncbi:hypothetical protein FO519_009733 [Halicephalobus sp. NKZ332]|nr:hypothetical protein FO519_009733 [Halicephalobus sp. NKZ332]
MGIPAFYHLPITRDLKCDLLFENSNKGSIYRKKLSTDRIIYGDKFPLETDCDSINDRGYFPKEALTEAEGNFPVAFARIVYRDYYLLESQLRVEYAPQNYYCYVIDSKADILFKKRVRNLGKCFNNVFVLDEEVDVRSNGHNMTIAHLACLKYLRSYPWKYAILLQNDDIRLRTNAEVVKILKAFNGANDIAANNPWDYTFNTNANWTLAALDLFKNKKLNTLRPLRITKSLVQVSISRAAVDYVFDKLNIGPFVKKLELKGYGVDELFWATLNANEVVNLPGGFTRKYLTRKIQTYTVTRYTMWKVNKEPLIPCISKYFRNLICVFGVEDLPNLTNLHSMYINKLLPEFDFAAATCLLENVYDRTYFPTENYSFDVEKYTQLRHVRFHKRRMEMWNQNSEFVESPQVV